jgi:hypothetical protein
VQNVVHLLFVCTWPLTFLISFVILQLLEGLLAALGNHAVYDVLNASETKRKNAWYQAFFEFYERIVGAAKDYEMPLGKKRIKNFKSKVVEEIWPLLDSIEKAKSNEIVRNDTIEPDEYDEIPLDKYLKVAIEQYATYNAIKHHTRRPFGLQRKLKLYSKLVCMKPKKSTMPFLLEWRGKLNITQA